MRSITYISAFCIAVAILSGCAKDINERKINPGSGLGFPVKVLDLEKEAGETQVAVLATMEYEITSGASWLTVPASAPAGRDGFLLKWEANASLPRAARVLVSISSTSHLDTLTVRQKGETEPELKAASNVISVSGSAAGRQETPLQTNIPDSDLAVDCRCEDTPAWISGVAVSGSSLVFDYEANPNDFARRAVIDVYYTGAFGEELKIAFQISQLSSSDSAGESYSFDQLFALATEEGTPIENDIRIEGIVVSDKAGGNCGDNLQLGATSIDYSISERTIYLESRDGSRGLRLETVAESDNVFEQGDLLSLSLRGTTLHRSRVTDPDTDPVYYEVVGFKGSMALSCEHLGRAGIPVKEKYMGALTDNDIFTYVTLKDCELPVRKGPLTPIAEQFTSAGGSNKVTKFGILLHDICGSSMYLYTNTTCTYRRDGSALPQGSGKMSGVVVHELYPRFSYMDNSSSDEETWGNIGRYQLRHTSKADFAMAQTMQEGSFSGIICEWRYILDKNLEHYYATDGDKEAYFTYSYRYPNSEYYQNDGRAGKLPINKNVDYSYLGPSGTGTVGNENGLGVILEDGSDWMGPLWNGYNSEYAANVNAKGNGEVPAGAGSAWGTNLTARGGAPMYTTFVFSTAGISSDKMSMQVSAMNNFYSSTQSMDGVAYWFEGPRFWWVEYSLDGNSWTPAAKYSLPEFCQTSPMTQLWQTPGFKPVNIPLPASELLGKETVYVRIIPDAAMQTGSKTAYLDETVTYPNSGSFPTAWNYVCFRYNTALAPATGFDGGSGIDPMNPIDYTW